MHSARKQSTQEQENLVILTLSQFDSAVVFRKMSSKARVKPWFFVTFNAIISHIFPENFFEIPQVVQKLRRISLSTLAIFLVTKKLMTSAHKL